MTVPGLQIGLLVFPRLTQLDLTGPFEAFARIPDATVHLVAKTMDPITSDVGLILTPTITLAECPDLDVVCVPGGPGINDLLLDESVVMPICMSPGRMITRAAVHDVALSQHGAFLYNGAWIE